MATPPFTASMNVVAYTSFPNSGAFEVRRTLDPSGVKRFRSKFSYVERAERAIEKYRKSCPQCLSDDATSLWWLIGLHKVEEVQLFVELAVGVSPTNTSNWSTRRDALETRLSDIEHPVKLELMRAWGRCSPDEKLSVLRNVERNRRVSDYMREYEQFLRAAHGPDPEDQPTKADEAFADLLAWFIEAGNPFRRNTRSEAATKIQRAWRRHRWVHGVLLNPNTHVGGWFVRLLVARSMMLG